MKRIVSGIMLTLLLVGMLTLAFNIQPVKAGTIIVPDDYPTIQEAINAASPGDIIYVYGPYYYEEEVIVNKSVSLIGRFGPGLISIDVVANDVYIQGFGFRTPWGFPYGRAIVLNGVSGCKILKVIVSGIDEGPGIVLTDASNNVISNSWVWGFIWDGAIVFESSSNNTIFGNTIEASWGSSIYLDDSSDNKFFHNQFYVYEARQVEVIGRSKNVWDDGYPFGGNYWSDYSGIDLYCGPYQNETGSDGIGDTPYVIDESNQDRYPFTIHNIAVTNVAPSKTVIGQGYSVKVNVTVTNQGNYPETFNVTFYANTTIVDTLFTNITLTNGNSTTLTFTWNTTGFAYGNYTIWAYAWPVPEETDTTDNTCYSTASVHVGTPGDINGDFKVDIKDLVLVIKYFGSYPGHPNWNPNADVNSDGKVDIKDLVLVIKHFGQHDP